MTHIESAKKTKITSLMKEVAQLESVDAGLLRDRVAQGRIVIPCNRIRTLSRPCGIGEGLRTKVNANIGTSPDAATITQELKKLKTAIAYGADTVMDLSIGGNLRKIRRRLLSSSTVPFGTVPLYEIACNAIREKGSIEKIDTDDIISVLNEQAEDGVDFFTIHAGLTYAALAALTRQNRVMDVVSRGGAFLAEWMTAHNAENPLYEHFDEILKIARSWDVTLSLGDGMRPGSIADATDRAQIQELIVLGELAQRANNAGVQVMIEGPGHVPLDQVETNVKLQKQLCQNRPFYVLGPLVTDVAPGYDHIVGAIGGALAAWHGADFLCYLTPSEHLRLPSVDDVKQGVIASRIAAHAADVAKGVNASHHWDKAISEARKKRDWKKQASLAIDGDMVKLLRSGSKPQNSDACTMCSNFCSLILSDKCLRRFSQHIQNKAG
jgi:phosphomethylpyrimidine synthase